MSEDDDDWTDYETGPFCRHWGDPGDCDEVCECGHNCVDHNYDDECSECPCTEWKDSDGTDTLKAKAEAAFGEG